MQRILPGEADSRLARWDRRWVTSVHSSSSDSFGDNHRHVQEVGSHHCSDARAFEDQADLVPTVMIAGTCIGLFSLSILCVVLDSSICFICFFFFFSFRTVRRWALIWGLFADQFWFYSCCETQDKLNSRPFIPHVKNKDSSNGDS